MHLIRGFSWVGMNATPCGLVPPPSMAPVGSLKCLYVLCQVDGLCGKAKLGMSLSIQGRKAGELGITKALSNVLSPILRNLEFRRLGHP